MLINKETQLYASLSSSPGSFGCKFHNEAFEKNEINAIYKSFGVKRQDIFDAIKGIKALNIRGGGISMPFKEIITRIITLHSEEVISIGAANTYINLEGIIKLYNTDWIAARKLLEINQPSNLIIIGNGGFSKAVQFAATKLFIPFSLIILKRSQNLTKYNINFLKNKIVFNATPIEIECHPSCTLLDCRIETVTGKQIALFSAIEQFRLYTGIELPV